MSPDRGRIHGTSEACLDRSRVRWEWLAAITNTGRSHMYRPESEDRDPHHVGVDATEVYQCASHHAYSAWTVGPPLLCLGCSRRILRGSQSSHVLFLTGAVQPTAKRTCCRSLYAAVVGNSGLDV